MTEHKFKTGQSVELRGRMGVWVPQGPFSVVQLLPPEGQQNQYRLKSTRDGHERVVVESDLSTLV